MLAHLKMDHNFLIFFRSGPTGMTPPPLYGQHDQKMSVFQAFNAGINFATTARQILGVKQKIIFRDCCQWPGALAPHGLPHFSLLAKVLLIKPLKFHGPCLFSGEFKARSSRRKKQRLRSLHREQRSCGGSC